MRDVASAQGFAVSDRKGPPVARRPKSKRLASSAIYPSAAFPAGREASGRGLNGCTKSKLDGYRMAARIDNGRAQLLTRTGLDWTDKYPSAHRGARNT